MSRIRKSAPKPRTTVPLTGTLHKQLAPLDSDSLLAIEWAQVWLRRQGSARVPAAGVIRRALALYIRHISQAEGRTEVRATVQVCKARPRPAAEHQLALLRLHAVPDEEPLPSFAVVRDGAHAVAERAAAHQRIEQLLEALP